MPFAKDKSKDWSGTRPGNLTKRSRKHFLTYDFREKTVEPKQVWNVNVFSIKGSLQSKITTWHLLCIIFVWGLICHWESWLIQMCKQVPAHPHAWPWPWKARHWDRDLGVGQWSTLNTQWTQWNTRTGEFWGISDKTFVGACKHSVSSARLYKIQ